MPEKIIPKKPIGNASTKEKIQPNAVTLPNVIQTMPKILRYLSIVYFSQIYYF
jgi:hypothetical protein